MPKNPLTDKTIIMDSIFDSLNKDKTYSLEELFTLLKCTKQQSDVSCYKKIQAAVRDGQLIKLGRNMYIATSGKKRYYYELSSEGKQVKELVHEAIPDVRFVIFESMQLNEFISHQIGNNAIIVYVEKEFIGFAFESLRASGLSVLYDPNIDLFYRHFENNIVVVKNIISRAPDGEQKNTSSLEKLIVDMIADELVNSMVEASEIKSIYENIKERYILNDAAVISYAKRRNAEKYIRDLMR